jgi:hypothetical protein
VVVVELLRDIARDLRATATDMARDFLCAASDFAADLRAFIQPRN